MTTTLYRRGRVHSPEDPDATALLVDGDTVAWLGSEAAAEAYSAERTVDLDGAWVAPAFVDAHVHLTATGLQATGLDLTGAASLREALDAVRSSAEGAPGDVVVMGSGWDETRWPEKRPPTAAELDVAAGGRAVYLARVDVHSAVASGRVLDGTPHVDGLVRGDAHHQVRARARAALTEGQRRTAQRTALRRAAALGVASVHECSGPDVAGEDDLRGLLQLVADDAGLPEVVAYWGEAGGAERARELGALGAAGDLFLDGSLGSRTAALTSPYADDPAFSWAGELQLDLVTATRHVVDCTRLGLQAGFHAIGDAAVQLAVSALRGAAEQLGDAAVAAARHRLEHVELVGDGEARELARLGVVASVQPAFDAVWGGTSGMYAARLGGWRASKLNPFRTLLEAGVGLALGSDCPVTPLDPWGALRAAVGHRTPTSAITPRAAFAAHTRGGWRAQRDDASGVLVPGAPATFAVWDGVGELVRTAPADAVAGWSTDPRGRVPALPDLASSEPVARLTVVRGRVVHDVG